MRDFFEPILRADFNIVENYTYTKKDSLTIPIDVLYGKFESSSKLNFLNWKKESLKNVNIQEFEGDHFFIYNYGLDISKYILDSNPNKH